MSDSVRVTCPECESTLRVGSKAWGKTVKCPHCKSPLAVPHPMAENVEAQNAPTAQKPEHSRSRAASAPSRQRGETSPSRRTSITRPSNRNGSGSDFDLGTALEGIEEYEELSSGEDFESYDDYEAYSAAPSRKKTAAKVDTSVRGVWRDGKILVIAHGARLPKRCIKTNEPGSKKKHVELAYTHPMVYIVQLPLILLMLPFGGFVFFQRYRKAEVDLWYSKNWIRNQRLAWLFGVLTCLAGMGMIAWGILSMRLILAPLGLFCMFAGLIYPGRRESISVQKIDEHYVRMRGAGRPFLNSLPAWRKSRDR